MAFMQTQNRWGCGERGTAALEAGMLQTRSPAATATACSTCSGSNSTAQGNQNLVMDSQLPCEM